jgi:16S rRNA (cytosine1402-N4)-methyltransferase
MAAERFAELAPELTCTSRFIRASFVDGLAQLHDEGVRADLVLMDLGMSSMQVDTWQRGFSYAYDAPLDMRMDPSLQLTAHELVNTAERRRLEAIFRDLGEERYARQISRAIVRARGREEIATTNKLVDVVSSAIPAPARFAGGHPAKRVFQALRIAVNDELTELEEGLESAIEICEVGGRIAVISFHSLEDRIVKHRFREAAHGCICPPDLPVCGCGRSPEFRVVNSRVIRPSEAELARNPRAASGRLRVAQREVAA